MAKRDVRDVRDAEHTLPPSLERINVPCKCGCGLIIGTTIRVKPND